MVLGLQSQFGLLFYQSALFFMSLQFLSLIFSLLLFFQSSSLVLHSFVPPSLLFQFHIYNLARSLVFCLFSKAISFSFSGWLVASDRSTREWFPFLSSFRSWDYVWPVAVKTYRFLYVLYSILYATFCSKNVVLPTWTFRNRWSRYWLGLQLL